MGIEIMTKEAGNVSFKQLVKKWVVESIGREIQKKTNSVFALRDVFIRRIKVLKTPKFDIEKLMELHGGSYQDEDLGMPMPASLSPPPAAFSRPARPANSRSVGMSTSF